MRRDTAPWGRRPPEISLKYTPHCLRSSIEEILGTGLTILELTIREGIPEHALDHTINEVIECTFDDSCRRERSKELRSCSDDQAVNLVEDGSLELGD